PLRQVNEKAADGDAVLFKPAAAYRVRRDTNTDTPLPPEIPAGTNPPDGAIIDYYLPHAPSGPVTLEIHDATGKLVRRYASTDKPEFDVNELERTLGVPTYWVRAPRVLSAEAGMHRWVWDIHYETLTGGRGNYPISAVPHDTPREPGGPRAAPGTYTVKLMVDGKTYSQPLTIKMDPRVKSTPVEVGQLTSAELRVASAMKTSAETVASIRLLQTDLGALSGKVTGAAADAVAAAQKKAIAIAGEAPAAGAGRGGRGGGGRGGPATGPETLPRLSGEYSAVYGLMDTSDTAPTATQAGVLRTLDAEFAKLMLQWTGLKTKDIPALNEQLKKAGLPPIEIKGGQVGPSQLEAQ
ncbi:MAG TPA: hypothetical protein VLV89_13060, partial [Candidatus Acidoferrum sp.]|nr:hypothetical protein [Candidatus Acidoferrum sp.]